jgi:hypothetical protein
MTRWRAMAACWLLFLASCASDGGQRGTGISVAAGNVATVGATTSSALAGIEVSIEGTELHTMTNARGEFVLRGKFAGDTALRFERARDAVSARLPVSAPAGGRLDIHDVVLDASGTAEAELVEVAFEGSVESLACAAARVTLASVQRAADDLETYDVALTGSRLVDAAGNPLTCADLQIDDRLDVRGVFIDDGTIGDADLVRK